MMLPRVLEQQLRRTVPNRGRRKRLRKEMHSMMRQSHDGGELFDERRQESGQFIPNRAMRRGTWKQA